MQSENEQKLKDLIIKWTNHFSWRKDFLKWREQRLWQEKHQDKTIIFLEKFIPDLKKKRILDLGSGMGGFLVAMQKIGYDIQGIEPNPDYCEITKLRGKRYDLEARVVNASGEKMPFFENSFDFIFCNDVLEHCKNPRQLLTEVYRTLKTGDKAYVTVINRFGFKDPHYHLRFVNWLPRILAERYITWRGKTKKEPLYRDKQKLSEMHYFTFKGFKKMAKEIGFETKDLKEYKILHPELLSSPRVQKIVRLLKLLKIGLPIYRFSRLFYVRGFELMLRK